MKDTRSPSSAVGTKTIWSLAWPTMLEETLHTAVQYIDTAMVGTLGTAAVAAVGSTTTVNWLVGGSMGAVGVGFLSYISQARGSGDAARARRASAQAVFVAALLGLFLTALALLLAPVVPSLMQVDKEICPTASRYFAILYAPMLLRSASTVFGMLLRSAGDTKTPMKVGLLVNTLNVVLNFCFIYPTRTVTVFAKEVTLIGAGLGVEGAALASAVSMSIGGILLTVLLFLHKEISPRSCRFWPDPQILSPCLKVALPNLVQRFSTSFGYVVFATMINAFGEVSTAAHTVANTVEAAFYIPGYGMQSAAATLAGSYFGERDREKMRALIRRFLPLELVLMVASGAALFLGAPLLVRLFTQDAEVQTLAVTVLRMVAVTEPFYGVSIIVEGMLLGVGNPKTPFLYNILGMWGVRIVGTLICSHLFSMGLVAAWSCMIAHNLLLFFLYFYQYKSEKWIPKF